MDIRRSYHPEADRLSTVAMHVLEKYSGTYRTRSALHVQIEVYLEKEYPQDLRWLNREKDMEGLVDLVKNAGGILIVELPPPPEMGGMGAKTVEVKVDKGGKEEKAEEVEK
ncbi:hypothetical protein E8E12_005691 [Didymella heteroderae]|uniref:Uncharacterized protein n=1 Tax=Didymella heteroderae TaxID=1769908 RepID=A0A9P4WSI0_9PLEO|nr:hypothetical protein E8E12_005691 [Didymella heteroderae]